MKKIHTLKDDSHQNLDKHSICNTHSKYDTLWISILGDVKNNHIISMRLAYNDACVTKFVSKWIKQVDTSDNLKKSSPFPHFVCQRTHWWIKTDLIYELKFEKSRIDIRIPDLYLQLVHVVWHWCIINGIFIWRVFYNRAGGIRNQKNQLDKKIPSFHTDENTIR